jgi:CRP/FNR family transcriptional regulator, cyclic AMP receptor protein
MTEANGCCADFSRVIRERLDQFREGGVRRGYRRHEVIYGMGDPADAIYLLESGHVKLQITSAGGGEKTLGICQPGEVFGELCLCGVVQRPEEASALEAATAVSFRADSVLRRFSQDPGLARSFFQLVCGRVLECQQQVGAATFEDVPRRLARELLRLSQLPESQRENGAVRLGLSLTHEELAALIGTSRGMITTTMNLFREHGMVDYRPRTIHVFVDRLKQYLKESV